MKNSLHEIQLTLERFSKKGNGIGQFVRQDGRTCALEVPFTVPGDHVLAAVCRKRRSLYQGKLQEILKPSVERVPARCCHFGVCGGCRWQQLPYRAQLDFKQEMVVQAFAGLLSPDVEVGRILPCDNEWGYRNKMEYTFSSDRAQNRYLGLIMDSTKGKVFNLIECHLPHSWFAEAVKACREWWHESGLDAYHPASNKGSLRTLNLREGQRTGDRMVNLTVSGNPDYALKQKNLDSLIQTIRQAVQPENPDSKLSIFLTIHQAIKGQPTRFFEMHLYGADHIREVLHIQSDPLRPPESLTFKISSSAFFQPNTSQAEKIYNTMIRMAEIPSHAVIYDLYCGTGTLGICCAAGAKQVIGIEISREACLDARHNAAANKRGNVEILSGPVHQKLEQIRLENSFPLPDIVLVDPPRAGLGQEAIAHIVGLNPAKVGYIACNPTTQAEDIKILEAHGYRLKAVQPVDQFPHTVHIENIALLVKRQGSPL